MASVKSLAGKVVLITGASSGIGLATARKFASLGASLSLLGRNVEALNTLESELKGTYSVPTATHKCDVTNETEVDGAVKATFTAFGRLDVLVNSAGVLHAAPAQATTPEIFDHNFNVNTRGPFLMMRACIPYLEGTKGCIVNVSSVNGMQSFAGTMAYCASKAALDQMTRCAALDLAPKGIRVNSVNPGVTRTELQKRGGMSDDAYAAFLERSKVTHPLGRIAEPSEVASLIAFLASEDEAGFITGAIVPIDGGRACLGAR